MESSKKSNNKKSNKRESVELKKLIILNGAMGVGKTSVGRALNKRMYGSAWLDGDWCMMMNPLDLTGENQKIFLDNVHFILHNYVSGEAFEYVIFSWVLPRDEMVNYMIKRLSDQEFQTLRITLLCEDNTLIERMKYAGRDMATIGKSIAYQEVLRSSDTVQIDTTNLSEGETVEEVLRIIRSEYVVNGSLG